jgi:hypothetical protein
MEACREKNTQTIQVTLSSAKLASFYLHLSRLLRPIWACDVFNEVKVWEKKRLQLTLTQSEIKIVLKKLLKFQNTLDQNIIYLFDTEPTVFTEFITKLKSKDANISSSIIEQIEYRNINNEDLVI